MRRIRIFQVDSFTKTPFQGNPAGVVLDADPLSSLEMQAIARELNNSETAFILSPDGLDHEVRLRFFTPSVEVPSCGHATIAAHYVRAKTLGLSDSRVIQKIGAGVLPVDISRDDGDYRIAMTQGAIEISPPLQLNVQNKITEALGLSGDDLALDFPLVIASTGHSKVMVGVRTRNILNALKPDMQALTRISAEIGCNGYFPFTLDSDDPEILVHGRMFAPAIGINEDPVTGNANGPLGAYLASMGHGPANGEFRFSARQGDACGRPGRVEVAVLARRGRPERVTVSGRAVIVFEAQASI